MFALSSSLSTQLPSNCWLLIALSWDTSLCSKTASCYHCCKEWLFGVSQYTYRCNLVLSALIAKESYYILVECAQLSMIIIQVPSQFCRARFRSGVSSNCSQSISTNNLLALSKSAWGSICYFFSACMVYFIYKVCILRLMNFLYFVCE